MKQNILTVKTRKTILPAILIAILCASIGLAAVHPVQAAVGELEVYGPLLIQWEYLTAPPPSGLGILPELVDVDSDRLTVNVKYDFYARVPYEPLCGVLFEFDWNNDGYPDDTIFVSQGWYSSAEGKSFFNTTGTHKWTSIGSKSFTVSATYYYLPYGIPVYSDEVTVNLEYVHNLPKMSDDEGDGELDGPWILDGEESVSIPPDWLSVGTEYTFRVHLYHYADSETDFLHGVVYQYDWGDGSPYDYVPAPLDGVISPEYGQHTWNSAGEYTVRARAGWYQKDTPEDESFEDETITWSYWDDMTVTVGYNPYPPIPDFYPVTVLARDENNNLLTDGLVYIDDLNNPAGPIGSTFYVVSSIWYQGEHAIRVELNTPGYTFDYFTDGVVSYGGNPVYLDITESMTLTAYYEPTPPPPVYHSVTVLAYFEYFGGYDNGGYIELDGAGAGFAPNTFSASEGTHQIKVNDIDYYYFLAKCDWLTYNGNTVYGNEVTLTIDSDITITAHYVFYGY